MASEMSDFVVDSNAHCFFCLSAIMAPKPGSNPPSPLVKQLISLQYLSRYLKMDMKKVFIDKEQIPPELLEKVEKARLKVELCETCRCLSERFSDVYQQLEKLEMELGFTLRLIHGKLVNADYTGKLRDLNGNGLLEVIDVLRMEAVEKSNERFDQTFNQLQKRSRKLIAAPRIKIQKLAETEFRTKQFKLINTQNHRSMNQESLQMSPGSDVESADDLLETSSVKVEYFNGNVLSDVDNANYLSDDAASNQDAEPTVEGDAPTQMEEIDGVGNADENAKLPEKQIVPRATRKTLATTKCSKRKSGKRKCNHCQREFKNLSTFKLHYQNIHLNLRPYKCISCNKAYKMKHHLGVHQRTSQSCSDKASAPKFTCNLCGKSYTFSRVLKRHMEQVHDYHDEINGNVNANKEVVSPTLRNRLVALKFTINPKTGKRKCKNCQEEFNTAASFTRHYHAVHLKGRKHKCTSCNKMFTQKCHLTSHQRTSLSCADKESAPKFECNLCGKSFTFKRVLQRHLDGVHYKFQKFECDLCGKKFNLRDELRVHRRKEHR